jgi:hypothetical protein
VDELLDGPGYVVGPAELGTDELLPGPDGTEYVWTDGVDELLDKPGYVVG